MKNKKGIKVTQIENNEPNSGSVGEFIELLKNFPADGKFTLNGNVSIDFDPEDDTNGVTIFPKEDINEPLLSDNVITNNPEDCENIFMKDYLYGITHNNPEFNKAIRETSSEKLIGSPIMTPVIEELIFEEQLQPNQLSTIDEIRNHNIFMAECLGELHRREIAALLEYNTQCLAHFGIETNKTMCDIVDNYKNIK